jgi:hypothetical protein
MVAEFAHQAEMDDTLVTPPIIAERRRVRTVAKSCSSVPSLEDPWMSTGVLARHQRDAARIVLIRMVARTRVKLVALRHQPWLYIYGHRRSGRIKWKVQTSGTRACTAAFLPGSRFLLATCPQL